MDVSEEPRNITSLSTELHGAT